MNTRHEDWSGRVMTLEGLIPAEQMGLTLPHEHLLLEGWDYLEVNYFNSASMELTKYVESGGKTLVDVSSIGRLRDPAFLRRLSALTGVRIIVGTGYYKDGWLSGEIQAMTREEMSETIIREIVEGIAGSGVRAGVIGEVGVSRLITSTERNSLAAAAMAQRATGAAISLHFEVGISQGQYDVALDILEAHGADLTQVAVGHLVPRPDQLALCQHLAKRGCYIEFDLFGQERRNIMKDIVRTHPSVQASSIRGFIDNGLLPKILLSQNVNHIELMTVNGGEGYRHILRNVVPMARSYGVSDRHLECILVENPSHFLAFRQ